MSLCSLKGHAVVGRGTDLETVYGGHTAANSTFSLVLHGLRLADTFQKQHQGPREREDGE